MQNDPPYLELHLHFSWLLVRLNIFSGLKAVISQTLNLLVRRDLEIIYLFPFVCFVFMFWPVYLLPDTYDQLSTVFFSWPPA